MDKINDRPTTITAVAPTLPIVPNLAGARTEVVGSRGVAPGRPRVFIAGAVVLVMLLVGSTAWGFTTQQDLSASRAALTSTRGDLEAARNDLTTTNATLATTTSNLQSTRTSLQQEQAARSAATAQIAQLQKQVALQTGCIQALNGNVAELRGISSLMSTNYNRITVGSTWAVAKSARDTALRNTIDDYYQGFSNAYSSAYTLANSWIATGNGQLAVASQQLTIMNAEIDKMNSTNSQIDAAFASFSDHLRSTNTTCGF